MIQENNNNTCPYCNRQIPKHNLKFHLQKCEETYLKKFNQNNKQFDKHVARIEQGKLDNIKNTYLNKNGQLKPKQNHQKKTDNSDNFYFCPDCGTKQHISTLETHKDNCIQNCEYCTELFPTLYLKQHEEQCKKELQEKINQESQIKRNLQNNNNENFYDQQDLQEQIEEYQQIQRIRHQNQRNGLEFFENQQFNQNQQQQRQQQRNRIQNNNNNNNNNNQNIMDSQALFQQQLQQIEADDPNDYSNNGGMTEEQIGEYQVIRFQKNKCKSMEKNNTECQICMAEYEEGDLLKFLDCTHRFHDSCIDKWLKKNYLCPVCKYDLKNKKF